jgi:hypothetical protein
MAIARAAAMYQLLDLNGFVRLAGLRFLPGDFLGSTLRFLVRLLDIYSLMQTAPRTSSRSRSPTRTQHSA